MRPWIIIFLVLLLSNACQAQQQYMGLFWNQSSRQIISGLDTGDATGDGLPEVAISGSSDGRVYLFDSRGGEIWTRDVGSYVNTVLMGDVNFDKKAEIMAGHADLSVFNISGDRIIRYSTPPGMGVYSIVMADLDGFGNKAIVFVSYDGQSCRSDRPAQIYAFDGAKKELKFRYSVGDDIPHVIFAADIDADGKDEILVGLIKRSGIGARCEKSYNSPSKILAIDSEGHRIWEFETGGAPTSIDAQDISGDGRLEIIIGAYQAIYVISSDGNLLWKNNRDIVTYAEDVAICGVGENAAVYAASANVAAFSKDGERLWTGITDARAYSLACADVDGDGIPELVAGSGSVYVFSKDGRQRFKSPAQTAHGHVIGADLNGDGHDEVLAASVKNIRVYRSLEYARRVRADEIFQKAISMPSDQKDEAIRQLGLAKEIYSDLGLSGGVSECLNQIVRLEDTSGKYTALFDEAMGLLDDSKAKMDAGQYLESYRLANRARHNLIRPEWQQQRDIADRRMDMVSDILKKNALEHMIEANKSRYDGEYDISYEHVLKARDIFNELGDFENAEKADMLAEILESEKGVGNEDAASGITRLKESINPLHLLIGFTGLLMIALFLGIAYYGIRTLMREPKKKGRARRAALSVDDLHIKTYSARHDAKKPKSDKKPQKSAAISYEGEKRDYDVVLQNNGFMKRKSNIVRYKKADDDVGLDQKLSEQKRSVKYGSDIKGGDITVEKPKNRGIFRAKECRKGICIRTKRIRRHGEEERFF